MKNILTFTRQSINNLKDRLILYSKKKGDDKPYDISIEDFIAYILEQVPDVPEPPPVVIPAVPKSIYIRGYAGNISVSRSYRFAASPPYNIYFVIQDYELRAPSAEFENIIGGSEQIADEVHGGVIYSGLRKISAGTSTYKVEGTMVIKGVGNTADRILLYTLRKNASSTAYSVVGGNRSILEYRTYLLTSSFVIATLPFCDVITLSQGDSITFGCAIVNGNDLLISRGFTIDYCDITFTEIIL